MSNTCEAVQTLRTSNYTIYVDLPDDADHMILVHGYSGAYDRVPREVGEYIRSLDVKPPKPLYGEWAEGRVAEPVAQPDPETIASLKKRGYLTQLTREEERSKFDNVVNLLHQRSGKSMPSYIFMPTYDCNLRCAYCFQDFMRTDPSYNHLLRFMTPSVIDRIVGALPDLELRRGLTGEEEGFKRFITLFGGEPLLRRGRKTIEYLLNALRKQSPIGVSAVTNATELEAYEDMLGPDGIAALQITLDGPPELHDGRRIHADGRGSFEAIARNIDLALDRAVSIDIRMNIDRTNIDSLPRLAEIFASRGWPERKGFSAYVAPVTQSAKNDNVTKQTTFNSYELREALRALQRQHPDMSIMTTSDDGLRTNLRGIFKHRKDPLPAMRASFCGAHTTMSIFDAFGDIYACWERTGDKNLRIGWVDENGKLELVADRLEKWRSRTVSSNDTCGQCRYSLYCGGGCAVLAEDLHGTMFGNYCDAFGKRFRTSVAEAFVEHARGDDVADSQILAMRAL